MSRPQSPLLDPSDVAVNSLERVISSDASASEEQTYVSVSDALTGQGVYELHSSRETTRVLFITRDTSLLNQTQQTLDGFVDISELFDEVHILILRPGIRTKTPVMRVSENVWIYVATASHWWWTPVVGYDLVRTELEFADGFRPDLILARDPFECGLLAYVLGLRFHRPTQLHVLEDYENHRYLKKEAHNRWRRFIARFTVPRFPSVRTVTKRMQVRLEQKYAIEDLETLPRFNNYEKLAKVESSLDLKEKYKPFVFVMLFIGRLTHESTLHRTMEAAKFVLTNPRVGLVVIGEGPARKEFERKAEKLGIREQVVFESIVEDIVGYLKSANILIVTDTDDDADEVAIRGAAVGTPLMLSHTEARDDIFVDGESALLCLSEDTACFSSKLGMYLNDIELRKRVGEAGQQAVLNKLHEDPLTYRQSYRDSIEKAFFVGEFAEAAPEDTDPVVPDDPSES